MSLYSDLQAEAEGILSEFGMPVTVKRLQPASYDPATGTATADAYEYAGYAVLIDYSGYELANNSGVQIGDKRLVLSAVDTPQPMPGDVVSVDGALWYVKSSTAASPAGAPIFYDLHIRQ